MPYTPVTDGIALFVRDRPESLRLLVRYRAQMPDVWCVVHLSAIGLRGYFLIRRTDLFDGRSKCVLHVAPGPILERKFRSQIHGKYVTADLFRSDVSEQMDICDIKHPDGTIDVIYCSHVLEHVVDDRKAMREFYRVLKIGGWAILNVPVTREVTFEDPTVTDPRERLRLFGQKDHVRRYGRDYIDRLREANFAVDVVRAADMLGASDLERMGLGRTGGAVYYCQKREQPMKV